MLRRSGSLCSSLQSVDATVRVTPPRTSRSRDCSRGACVREEEERSLPPYTLPTSALVCWWCRDKSTGPLPRAISRAVPQLDAHALRTNMPTFTAAKHIREFLSRQTVEQLEEAGECPAPPVYARVGQSARMRNADRLFTSQPLPC